MKYYKNVFVINIPIYFIFDKINIQFFNLCNKGKNDRKMTNCKLYGKNDINGVHNFIS